MTDITRSTHSAATADVDVVAAGFRAVADGDLAGFAAMFHPDATWNHRNDDRLGGVKSGVEAILGFLGTSMELTGGTLRPVPQAFLHNGADQVAVLTHVSGSRPDGRSFEDTQMLLLRLAGGRVCSVDQFIGDPTAVRAFWA